MYLTLAAQTVEILGMDLGTVLALLMFVVFMGLILTGYNVAYCFAAVALGFAFIADMANVISIRTFDPGVLGGQLPANWQDSLTSQVLLAVPLFVMMGAILERSGLAERLLNAIGLLMGSLRGGVAGAVIIVGTLLAAATGVTAATVIVMGLLSLPAMVKLGYDHKIASGAIVASGTLAQLLPPSIVLILLSNEFGVPIFSMFAGAMLPGFMLALMYVLYVLIAALLKPELGPAMPLEDRQIKGKPSIRSAAIIGLILSAMVFVTMLLVNLQVAIIAAVVVGVLSFILIATLGMLAAEVLVSIIPVVVLIMGVLLSIFQGVAPPSESGAVGVFGALVLSAFNYVFDKLLHADGNTDIDPRWRMNWDAIKAAASSTANITILVMTLLMASLFFRLMFQALGGADQVADWLSSIPGGKVGFVLIAMIAVFLLGINLEFLEITYIVVPIFIPAMDLLEFTEPEKVWFAVLMAVNLNMAFISPPVGFSLFYLQSVAPPEVKTSDIHKGALPFMGLQILALIILGVIPGITYFSYCMFHPNPSEQTCDPNSNGPLYFYLAVGAIIVAVIGFAVIKSVLGRKSAPEIVRSA